MNTYLYTTKMQNVCLLQELQQYPWIYISWNDRHATAATL